MIKLLVLALILSACDMPSTYVEDDGTQVVAPVVVPTPVYVPSWFSSPIVVHHYHDAPTISHTTIHVQSAPVRAAPVRRPYRSPSFRSAPIKVRPFSGRRR